MVYVPDIVLNLFCARFQVPKLKIKNVGPIAVLKAVLDSLTLVKKKKSLKTPNLVSEVVSFSAREARRIFLQYSEKQ